MNKLWMTLAVSILVSACGGGSEATDGKAQQAAGKPQQVNEREDTVFDPMLSTMDRAAGVQDTSDERKSQMDDAIDGAE